MLHGWEKYYTTIDYPLNANSPLYVCIGISWNSGTVYFDDVQLEEGIVANPYNFIENSSFYSGMASWSRNYLCDPAYDNVFSYLGSSHTLQLKGEANKHKYMVQTVNTSGSTGDVYNLSAWVYSIGVPNSGEKRCIHDSKYSW